MKKTICIIILLIIFMVLLTSFKKNTEYNNIEITGQVKTLPGKSLKGVALSFTLIDRKENNYHYLIDLEDDGIFHFQINEKAGKYYFIVNLSHYPEGLWKEPFFSRQDRIYFVQLDKGKTHHFEHLYVLEPIEVISPKENAVFKDPNEIVFEWVRVPYAGYYNISIQKIDNNEKDLWIMTNFIDDIKISYSQIFSFDVIRGELDTYFLNNIRGINRRFKDLENGTYKFVITAGILIIEKKEVIRLNSTSKIKEYIFYIE